MAAPYSDLCSKLEDALKSVVDTLGLDSSVTINTGFSTDEIEGPYVLLIATGQADELFFNSGIYTMSASVEVASNMDDQSSRAAHRDIVGTVFDAFMHSTVHVTLSAAVDDFHCYQVRSSSQPQSVEQRKIVNGLELDCVICGSNVS